MSEAIELRVAQRGESLDGMLRSWIAAAGWPEQRIKASTPLLVASVVPGITAANWFRSPQRAHILRGIVSVEDSIRVAAKRH